MFGKFENIEAYLDSYLKADGHTRLEHIHSLPVEKQVEALQAQQIADVAEVKATIKQR